MLFFKLLGVKSALNIVGFFFIDFFGWELSNLLGYMQQPISYIYHELIIQPRVEMFGKHSNLWEDPTQGEHLPFQPYYDRPICHFGESIMGALFNHSVYPYFDLLFCGRSCND